jgi:hypothetical protein
MTPPNDIGIPGGTVGVDAEATANSDNLITSGGVALAQFGSEPVYEHEVIIEESQTWTAPVTGLYKVTVIGGGGSGGTLGYTHGGKGGLKGGTTTFKDLSAHGGAGGGGGGAGTPGSAGGGGGAGEVKTKIFFLMQGESIEIIIGAGGPAVAGQNITSTLGSAGEDSEVMEGGREVPLTGGGEGAGFINERGGESAAKTYPTYGYQKGGDGGTNGTEYGNGGGGSSGTYNNIQAQGGRAKGNASPGDSYNAEGSSGEGGDGAVIIQY